MSAKSDLLTRLSSFERAIVEPALINKSPSEVEHNSTARILRNGLAVVGFALFADFLRERIAETIQCINGTSVAFASLPDTVRKSATVDAIAGVFQFLRSRRLDPNDAQSLVQSVSQDISSTMSTAFAISPFGISSTSSNINSEDISDVLRTICIEGGWASIGAIASRAGFGGLALSDEIEGHGIPSTRCSTRCSSRHTDGGSCIYGEQYSGYCARLRHPDKSCLSAVGCWRQDINERGSSTTCGNRHAVSHSSKW